MKRNKIYNYLYGLMAGALLLGATSCKDDTFAGFNDESGDEVEVTFNLSPEGALGTRADGTPARISDGTKADMLVYAIYDKDGNLLDEYGKGKVGDVPESKEIGVGQTAIITTFPHTITLTLKRTETYKIAFWAQSSRTTAYNTADLQKVEVNYSQITDASSDAVNAVDSSSTPNNDEWRDAFCRSVEITPGNSGGIEQNIHLFRPLAQINIGTNGYDYEIATRSTNLKYLYSKIRINRVARYLDVVADKTYISTTENEENDDNSSKRTPEAFAVVDYGWAPIPAYNNKQQDNGNYTLPDLPSYSKWDWIYDPEFTLNVNDQLMLTKDNYTDVYGDEEFLKVKYAEEGDSNNWVDKQEDGYHGYANLNNHYNDNSETFKWLSMCYVLTASTETSPVVINNIKVWLSTDGTDDTATEIININQVPAQRNWRTNIIGNILTEENDFSIKLDKAFAGEFSGWSDGTTWKWTGPIASGVYYNGDDDVIEISSKEGLLWFQKMVNGDLTVREAVDQQYVGKDYYYYDSSNQSTQFSYKALPKPDDSELVERIMVATHQKYNVNKGWPEKNNFHFTGTDESGNDYPATVRLMADIDLAGEEWIPIGFEGRIGEQLGWSVIKNDEYTATDDRADGRIFYGIFDGNGHTIYNLSTKRFSANVHETAQQSKGYRKVYITDTRHPSDNPQWFGRGLFGQIGGNAKVTNVRLNNVDIYGCNGVAGIVGIAYGDAIEISNNIVDGGSIIDTPMFRGDSYRAGRTFARGVYMGGIVGYFNTNGGKVDNNIVRNVYMQAVRRAGGLIGSINQQWMDSGQSVADEGQGLVDGTWKSQRESKPASISNNQLNNVVLVISSFTAYGERLNINNKYDEEKQYDLNDNIARAGFGYNNGNLEMYSQKFVGGHELPENQRDDLKEVFKGNTESGVTFAKLVINYPDKQLRTATIESMPLVHMPMLSSWYADNIELKDNYYGEPSARTKVKLHKFNFFSQLDEKTGYTDNNTNFNKNNGIIRNGGNTYYVPMNIPFDVDIDYVDNSPKVGIFVESVTLDGKGGIGGRSVITPVKVNQDDNDCVMYITARDRFQFENEYKYLPDFMPEYMKDYADIATNTTTIKQPTIVKNMVLRGEPYANNGILLAPNKNLHRVELHNVAIYDVYKTLALYDWSSEKSQMMWPNRNAAYDALTRNDQYATPAKVENLPVIVMEECNLRGYTVPGTAWREVTCKNTTFECGASTGHGEDEYTYKAEVTTEFNGCFFKAPYIIDMTELSSDKSVTFINSYATAAAAGSNVLIDLTGKTGCDKIVITTEDGKPVVKYYKDKGETELK